MGGGGGTWEFMTPVFKERWWKGASLQNATKIQCEPLQDLLRKHAPGISFYDFMSVDVEGAEVQALESIDYDENSFGVIFVEESDLIGKDVFVRTFLESKGYMFAHSASRSQWFVNNQFHEIYDGLVA